MPKEGTYPLPTSPDIGVGLIDYGVAFVKVLVSLAQPLPLRGERWLFIPLPREGWGLIKTFRTNGSLEPGWGLEEIAEMLSERSEFISAFQAPAWRPMSSGRFLVSLLLLFFFAIKEKRMNRGGWL